MSNIKNLPAGKEFFTEIGYSQSYPWMVVSKTAKTVKLARVEVSPDPEFKPEFHKGGFCAHCSNQSEQTWLFDSVSFRITKTVRMTKKGWSHKGTKFVEGRATYFYDYNF